MTIKISIKSNTILDTYYHDGLGFFIEHNILRVKLLVPYVYFFVTRRVLDNKNDNIINFMSCLILYYGKKIMRVDNNE